MIERFTTGAGGLNKDGHLLAYHRLANIVLQRSGTNGTVQGIFGTLLMGGRGGVLHSTVGIVLMMVLKNGLVVLGVSQFWQDTIQGFKEIIEGKHDDVPEQAFYMVGSIDEVLEKAKQMA